MRHTCLARRGALLRLVAAQHHRLPTGPRCITTTTSHIGSTASSPSSAQDVQRDKSAHERDVAVTRTLIASPTLPPRLPPSHRTGHEMAELLDGLLTTANAHLMTHSDDDETNFETRRALFVRLFEAVLHRTMPGTRGPAYIAEQCLLFCNITAQGPVAALPLAVQMQCLRPSPQLLLAQRLTPLQELPDSLRTFCTYSLPSMSNVVNTHGATNYNADKDAVRVFAQGLVSALSETAGLTGSAAIALRSRLVQQQQRKASSQTITTSSSSKAETLRHGNVCTLQAIMDCVTLQLYLIHALFTIYNGSIHDIACAMLQALEVQRFVFYERGRYEGQRGPWQSRTVHGLAALVRHALERGAWLSNTNKLVSTDGGVSQQQHKAFRELQRLRSAVQATLTFYFAVLPHVTSTATASSSCTMLTMLEQCWHRAATTLQSQPSVKEALWWLQLVPILLETYNTLTERIVSAGQEGNVLVTEQESAPDILHAHIGQLLRAMIDVDAASYARCRKQQLQAVRQGSTTDTTQDASSASPETSASSTNHEHSSAKGSSDNTNDNESTKESASETHSSPNVNTTDVALSSSSSQQPGLRRVRGKRSLFYQDEHGNRVLREEARVGQNQLLSTTSSSVEQGTRRARFISRGSHGTTHTTNHALRSGGGSGPHTNAVTLFTSEVPCSALFAALIMRHEAVEELSACCALRAEEYDGVVEAVWLGLVCNLQRAERLLYRSMNEQERTRVEINAVVMRRMCAARARLPLSVLEAVLHICHGLSAALRNALAQSPHATLTPRLRSRRFGTLLYKRSVLLTLAIGSQMLLSSPSDAAPCRLTLLHTVTQLWSLRSSPCVSVNSDISERKSQCVQGMHAALGDTMTRRWGRVMATHAAYEELRSLHAANRGPQEVQQNTEEMLAHLRAAAEGRQPMLPATRQAMAAFVLRGMKTILSHKNSNTSSSNDAKSNLAVCATLLSKLVALLATDRALLLLCCYPSFLHGLHDVAVRLTRRGIMSDWCDALHTLVVQHLMPVALSLVVAAMQPVIDEVMRDDKASHSTRHSLSRSSTTTITAQQQPQSSSVVSEKIHVLARCVPALQLLASLALLHDDARRVSRPSLQGTQQQHSSTNKSVGVRSVDQSVVDFAWTGPFMHVVASCLSCMSLAGGWRSASQRRCLIPLPPLSMFAANDTDDDSGEKDVGQWVHVVSGNNVSLSDWLLILDASNQLFSRQPHTPLMYTPYVDQLVTALGDYSEAETNMAAATDTVTWVTDSQASLSLVSTVLPKEEEGRDVAATQQTIVREWRRGGSAMERWQAHLHRARLNGLHSLGTIATQAACLSTDWLQPLILAAEHYLRTLRLEEHLTRSTATTRKSNTTTTCSGGPQYRLSESTQEGMMWLLLDLLGTHLVGQRGSWTLLRAVLNLCGSAMHAEAERRRGAFSAVHELAVAAVLAQLTALPSPSEVNIIGAAATQTNHSFDTPPVRDALVYGVLLPQSFASCMVELSDAVARMPTTVWGIMPRQTRGKGLLVECTRDEMRALLYGVRQAVLYLQAAERVIMPGAVAAMKNNDEDSEVDAEVTPAMSAHVSATQGGHVRSLVTNCPFQAVAASLQGSALGQQTHFVLCTVLCTSFVLELTAASALQDSRIEDELCAVLAAAMETLSQMLTRNIAYIAKAESTQRNVASSSTTALHGEAQEGQRAVLLWAGLCVCTNMTAVMLLDRVGRVFTPRLQRCLGTLVQHTATLAQCNIQDNTTSKSLCHRLQRGLQLLGSMAIFSTRALDRLAVVYADRADVTAMLTSLRLLAGATVRDASATQTLLCTLWHRVQEEMKQTSKPSIVFVPSLPELRATLESFNTLRTAPQTSVRVSKPITMKEGSASSEEVRLVWDCDVHALLTHVTQEETHATGNALPVTRTQIDNSTPADMDIGTEHVHDDDDETSIVMDSSGQMLRVEDAIAEELLSMNEIVDVVIAQAALVLRAPATALPLLVTSQPGQSVAQYVWHVADPVRLFFDNVMALLQCCSLAEIMSRPMVEVMFKVLFMRFAPLAREPGEVIAGASLATQHNNSTPISEDNGNDDRLDSLLRPPQMNGAAESATDDELGLSASRVRQMWRLLADKWRRELLDAQGPTFATYQAELLRAMQALRARNSRTATLHTPATSNVNTSQNSRGKEDAGQVNATSKRSVSSVEDIFVMHPLGSVASAGQRTAHMRDEVTVLSASSTGNTRRSGRGNNKNGAAMSVAGNWSAVMAQERDIRPITESIDKADNNTQIVSHNNKNTASQAYVHYRDVYHPPQPHVSPSPPLPLLMSLLRLLMQGWKLCEPMREFAEAVCVYVARQYVLLRPCLADSAVNVVPLLATQRQGNAQHSRTALWQQCVLPSDDAVKQSAAMRAVASQWLQPEPQSALYEALQVIRTTTSNDVSNEELVMDYVRYSAVYLKLLAQLLTVINYHGLLLTTTTESKVYTASSEHAMNSAPMPEGTTPCVVSTRHLVTFTPAEMDANVYEETFVHLCNVSYHVIRHIDSLTHAALDADAQQRIVTSNSHTPCTSFVDELRAIVVSTLQEVLQNCAKECKCNNCSSSGVLVRRPLASRILLLLLRNSSGGLTLHLPSLRPSSRKAAEQPTKEGNNIDNSVDKEVHKRLHKLRTARPELFVSSPVMLALMTPNYLQQVAALYLQSANSSMITCVTFCLEFHMLHGTEAQLGALLAATTALLGATPMRNAALRLYCEQLVKALLNRPQYRRALHAASIAAAEDERTAAVVEDEILVPFLAAMARFDVQVSKRALAQLLHSVMRMRKDLFGHPPTADRQDKLSLAQTTSHSTEDGQEPQAAGVPVSSTKGTSSNATSTASLSDTSTDVPDALVSFSVERGDVTGASHRRALAALHLSLPTVMEVAMHLRRMRVLDKAELLKARGMLKAADDARRERMSMHDSLRQQAADVYTQSPTPSTITSVAKSANAADEANRRAAVVMAMKERVLSDTTDAALVVDAGLHLEDPWDYGVAILHLDFALRKILHAAVRHLAPHLDMRDVADVMEMLHIVERLAPAGEAGQISYFTGNGNSRGRPLTRRPSGMMTGTLRVLLARALMGAHSLGFTSLGRPQYMPLSKVTGGNAVTSKEDRVQPLPLLLPTSRNDATPVTGQKAEEEETEKNAMDAAAERRIQLEAEAAVAVANSIVWLSAAQRRRARWAMFCIHRYESALQRKQANAAQRRRRWQQRMARQEVHSI